MDYKTLNFILDFVLIAASIWMLLSVRGIGGIVGQSLTLIIAGAIVLGLAHLLATLASQILGWDATFNNFIHRLVVLLGFILLAFGFQRVRQLSH